MMVNQSSNRNSDAFNKEQDPDHFDDDSKIQPIFEDNIDHDYGQAIKGRKIDNQDNQLHEQYDNPDEESKSINNSGFRRK